MRPSPGARGWVPQKHRRTQWGLGSQLPGAGDPLQELGWAPCPPWAGREVGSISTVLPCAEAQAATADQLSW